MSLIMPYPELFVQPLLNMTQNDLIPHLFRAEFSKITAVLCKNFGIGHIETAEDIASETFQSALETWTYRGIPENPVAWLYTVAKNKARNILRRIQIFTYKIAPELTHSAPDDTGIEIDLSDQSIADSQLQMLFAVCHPSLSGESQIGLALRILCGFGIEEIANAFLTNKETVNKRLFRAKEKLRSGKIRLEYPSESEIAERLDAVLRTLYLLFNEGYYSESNDAVLREDVCLEAMRLTYLLLENDRTSLPAVHALFALMCFHASRFRARKNKKGEPVLYRDQDETLWDNELIAKGAYHLNHASHGDSASGYHIEATIAYWHTVRVDTGEKWENILKLYDMLLKTEYSPIAALNRLYAFSKVYGKAKAIAEAENLQLSDNHYYFTLLGELYSDIDSDKAKLNFRKALSLAKTVPDKKTITEKLETI
jgi:RNA polymerase sigma factor (sigma-70 family)